MGINSGANISSLKAPDDADLLTLGAQRMRELRDQVDSLLGGQFTSYTPVWGASGTAPALGAGTLTGRYKRVGRNIKGWLKLTMAADTTFGTGSWNFTLPTTCAVGTAGSLGTAILRDSAPSVVYYTGLLYAATTSLMGVALPSGGQANNTAPFAWTTGDILSLDFEYEAATD